MAKNSAEQNEYLGIANPKQQRSNAWHKARPFVFAAIAIVLIAAAVVCWWFLRAPDISTYADEPITFVGLTDEEITLTAQDLADMDCERVKAVGTSDKAGTITGYGPTIQTLLAQYGKSLDDVKKIRVTCKDGYYQIIRGDNLHEGQIILSIAGGASGKSALYEKQQPLRFVLPDGDSALWSYGVERVEIVYTWDKDSAKDARLPSRIPQSEIEENGD